MFNTTAVSPASEHEDRASFILCNNETPERQTLSLSKLSNLSLHQQSSAESLLYCSDDENSFIDSGVEDSPFIHCRNGQLDAIVTNARSPTRIKRFAQNLLTSKQQKSELLEEIVQSRIRTKLFADSEVVDDVIEQQCSCADSGSPQWSIVSDHQDHDAASSTCESMNDNILMDDTKTEEAAASAVATALHKYFSGKPEDRLTALSSIARCSSLLRFHLCTVKCAVHDQVLQQNSVRCCELTANDKVSNTFNIYHQRLFLMSMFPSRGKVYSSEHSDGTQVIDAESEKNMNDRGILNLSEGAYEDEELIGDFSKPFCLPVVDSRHHDLKCISAFTLNEILASEYSHIITKFFIVDCRYPYEFDGGHIQGAINICNKQHLLDTFFNGRGASASHCDLDKRVVIIFHCEFSSERAPKMMRFMRRWDRQLHHNSYPLLYYPELYLLSGGYEAFCREFGTICQPAHGYISMFDCRHREKLRYFRGSSHSMFKHEFFTPHLVSRLN